MVCAGGCGQFCGAGCWRDHDQPGFESGDCEGGVGYLYGGGRAAAGVYFGVCGVDVGVSETVWEGGSDG